MTLITIVLVSTILDFATNVGDKSLVRQFSMYTSWNNIFYTQVRDGETHLRYFLDLYKLFGVACGIFTHILICLETPARFVYFNSRRSLFVS